MKKITIILSVILLFFAVIFFLLKENMVCFEKKCFDVEIVDTPKERETGLMYREQMDENIGMLFIFEESGNYPFWMKNTLIPLDMIWIDETKKVVAIKTAEPCKEDPCEIIYPFADAKYVLELNSGLANINGIKVGDYATFKI